MPSHTIAQNLQRLQTARTNIASAITTKGGTVASGAGFEDFSTAIGTIPSGGSATLITKNISANGTYNASSDSADGYSSVTVAVPNTYSAGDEGKVVSNGALVAQSARPDTITTNGSYITTNYNSVTVNVPTGGGGSTELVSARARLTAPSSVDTRKWISVGVVGVGGNVWSDGDYTYLSNGTSQKVLVYNTSNPRGTWNNKTWTGLTDFYGAGVWTDGTDIYYSYGNSQYVLDKSTSTWSTKTWTGLTSFYSEYTWSDGTDVYHSNGSNQYVLDKSTSTWSAKTWTGLTNLDGRYIWTDGTDIYYNNQTDCYVLNKSTSTWETKTWTGWPGAYAYGNNIWTDGTNIYYSAAASGINLVLDKATSTWNSITWTGLTSFDGGAVWTDGNTIFYTIFNGAYCLINPVTGIASV